MAHNTNSSAELPVYVSEKEAAKTTISIIDYDKTNFKIIENPSLDQCIACKNADTITWVKIVGLSDIPTINEICTAYEIHPLIREDIFTMDQRPKCDIMDNYVFVSLKLHSYNIHTFDLSTEQISIVFGGNFVISFEEKESGIFNSTIERLKKQNSNLRNGGSDFLTYDLIDVVVDTYYKIFENIGDHIESIEERIIEKSTPELIKKVHHLKRKLITLRKSLWPMRDILNSLQRKQSPLVSDKTIFYLRDTSDHVVQLIDNVETYRDLLAGLLDLYMSTVNNHMNEIMKVLTIFASIFIPLTFIAGVYGMNFNTSKSPFNMPELNWYFGYPLALGIMAITVIALLIFFKRKKWY